MTPAKTDGLGRATFHHIARRLDVRPTAREMRWFKHIERHGPQSSEMLVALTRDTHRSKDTALRDLQKLRAAGFLRLPQQQRATERAEFKPYIYDLTRQASDHLAATGLAEPTLRPTGHWWHAYEVSSFTGSLDLATTRAGRAYIPAHAVLGPSRTDLAICLDRAKLIPDQFFAIRYADGYRAFMLEVDRGTEPVRSERARKSLRQPVDRYAAIFSAGLHHQHYGHRATTLALFVFTSSLRTAAFLEIVQKRAGAQADRLLAKTLPHQAGFAGMTKLHGQPWVNGRGVAVGGL